MIEEEDEHEDHEDDEDEEGFEEFVDDGLDWNTSITPIEGPFVRPNGREYVPRSLAGIQDIAFLDRCQSKQEHVLLYGPPGTGKTALPESAAFRNAVKDDDGHYKHVGMESIVCSLDTTEADFFGTFYQDPDTGNYAWTPGPLQRAVEQDIPIYVDEIFLADSRVLSATLYPLMDGRAVLRIPMNPRLPPLPVGSNFFVIGSGNPDVPGAEYSEALRDRFPHQIEVETDWELAVELGVPRNIVNKAKSLNDKRRKGLITWSPQLRALLDYRDNKNDFSKQYALGAMLGKTPFRDRDEVSKTLASLSGRRPDGERKEIKPLELGQRYGR